MNKPNLIALGDDVPNIATDAFVAPGATVVGRVTVGHRTSVWYGTVVRGDDEAIVVGDDCNLQDGCILHSDPGEPTVLGDRVSLGHGAIVHGARIDSDVLVGMGAVVLNGAEVGSGSVIAAGAVVRPGSVVPPGSLVAGVPAAIRREVTDAEREMVAGTPVEYVEKAQRHRQGRPVGED